MDRDATETVTPDRRDSQNLTGQQFIDLSEHLSGNITQYVQQNTNSPNTKLFSYLALLNAYVPDSFLLMSECQKVLGPPDPIDGGPPFEERMEPFTALITTSSPSPGRVRLIRTVFAQKAVDILADAGISRSDTVKNLMVSLCGDQAEQHTVLFIKDLLTKRECEENRKKLKKFARLIEDIQKRENSFAKAVSVLTSASDRFRQNHIFPQTLARLYHIQTCITQDITESATAEQWAEEAISRASNNSFVADTLGQIYKKRLKSSKTQEDIIKRADEAFRAFEDVERKAEAEAGPEMQDAAGPVNISDIFNNRGCFGFLQVAKITFEKLTLQQDRYVQNYKTEVEDKFDFFEWYLTYSKPDMETLEPRYFWKDVALCYEYYTNNRAADSTSFPGLLDSLNRGLFTSKWRRAGIEEAEKTVSDLEEVRNDLQTDYEANVDDVEAAERYILSNIILANLNPPQLTPVEELKTIIHRFLGKTERPKSCEFDLLVLLLFWPGGQPQVVRAEEDEEVEQHSTEDEGSDPDLQTHVTSMAQTFEIGKCAKYLRGRCLLPLFFLGKGSGLSRWIHKSRLDEIVEEKVNAEPAFELAANPSERDEEKWEQINEMWVQEKVWQLPEVQAILLPVQVKPCNPQMLQEEGQEEQEVFVCAGGRKIKATAKVQPDALDQATFYLGFTIQGPILFKAGLPPMPEQ